ncbi:DUF4136 domain-containing protein [Gilvibacter sp.]|uniref:DUF4136 domain-containing protein n=1 Tax=Gilvibacter sp. TaxID=2729997 RepID=UPI0025BC802C|nr:DUF4136 domain-containing protein [Gilvibacter sp.]NQX76924.1 DUF4136 domain-containing protein [Gilvibacter sp.]
MQMKKFLPLALLVVLVMSSCTSVRVVSDYDTTASFNTYQSFAFFKPGVDKAQISDLDKKRILRAIDTELTAKGMIKSDNPDLLISIFTKERERVDVYNNNFGWGWGWNPWWGGGFGGSTVSSRTEGTLYIDLIDTTTNELVWQGMGTANISHLSVDKKIARIQEIVGKILEEYPPQARQ